MVGAWGHAVAGSEVARLELKAEQWAWLSGTWLGGFAALPVNE